MSSKWTEAADRLPPKDGKYWVTLRSEDGEIPGKPTVLAFARSDDGAASWGANGWLTACGVEVLAWMPYEVPEAYMPATVQTYRQDGTEKEIVEVQTKAEVQDLLEIAKCCRLPEPTVAWKFDDNNKKGQMDE